MYPILFFYVALAAAMNSLCLLGPPVQISAGSLVSALIDIESTCEATLIFMGSAVPDIVFSFESISCPQVSILEMAIPPQVPNGDAIIFWQCLGQPAQSCFQAKITGGSNDPDNLLRRQDGTVRCLTIPSSPTTTLDTVNSGGTAVAETSTTETQITGTGVSPSASGSPTFWPHTTLSSHTSSSRWTHTTLSSVTLAPTSALTLAPTSSLVAPLSASTSAPTSSPSGSTAPTSPSLSTSSLATFTVLPSSSPPIPVFSAPSVVAKTAANSQQSCSAMG